MVYGTQLWVIKKECKLLKSHFRSTFNNYSTQKVLLASECIEYLKINTLMWTLHGDKKKANITGSVWNTFTYFRKEFCNEPDWINMEHKINIEC